MYLFAHNNGDGGFGENGDQDIIKCGSFTAGSGLTEVDVGFEPQWLLLKSSSAGGSWGIIDTMRGFTVDNYFQLTPNATIAESGPDTYRKLRHNGFVYDGATGTGDFIYMAIRRGPMKTPESGTEVFDMDMSTTNSKSFDFAPDLVVNRPLTGTSFQNQFVDRLRGSGVILQSHSTAAETTDIYHDFHSQGTMGSYASGWAGFVDPAFYAFRRAPGFFDVVAYTGTGASLTLDHNLGVAPELVIMRRRDATANWAVSLPGHTQYAYLNLSNAAGSGSLVTSTSATQMTIIGDSDFNISGSDAIAYLFATLPGISKVGSYSGTGASQDIDCGFSNGARFVLLKETNGTSSWIVLDSERGINAGNDPILSLNNTNAEYSGDDFIDPLSSGFTLAGTPFNGTGEEYIFLAIA